MREVYIITCLRCHLYESRIDESDARWLKNTHDGGGHLAALRRVRADD